MNARKSDEIRSGSSQPLVFGEQRRCFPLVDRVRDRKTLKFTMLREQLHGQRRIFRCM